MILYLNYTPNTTQQTSITSNVNFPKLSISQQVNIFSFWSESSQKCCFDFRFNSCQNNVVFRRVNSNKHFNILRSSASQLSLFKGHLHILENNSFGWDFQCIPRLSESEVLLAHWAAERLVTFIRTHVGWRRPESWFYRTTTYCTTANNRFYNKKTD